MNRGIIITCFILLFVAQAQAQTEEIFNIPRFRLGVEAGIDGVFGEKNKPPMIRENHSSYYDGDNDYYCGFIFSTQIINSLYLGLKPEYVISKRFTVSAGVRFSFNSVKYDSDRDYFLWKVNESSDGTNTNYLKIEEITQKSYYVGIPIEIKFFPREIDYPVRHYFIIGTTLNFLATSTEEVSFKNPAMKKYESSVSNQISPSGFYQYLYGGFGLKMGNTKYPFVNIEFHFPVLVFADDKPNSLVNMNNVFGFGGQMSLQIPLFKKHQLTYTVIDDND